MNLIDSTVNNDNVICKFAWSSDSEQAFCSIVNSLLDVPSFVVKLTAHDVSFNINGKYFILPLDLVQEFTDVFALENTTSLDDGTLKSGELTTLTLSRKLLPNSLHILERHDGVWQIPIHSQVRISKTNNIVFDDGEI